MLNRHLSRVVVKAVNGPIRPNHFSPASCLVTTNSARLLSQTTTRSKSEDDPNIAATTKAPKGASGDQEGRFARIDESVQIPHPSDSEMPAQPVVQGRGGMHFKRTLASFSLDNKVSLVTGGARGLGLVMAQGLVASGSSLAIVDLNSKLEARTIILDQRANFG